MENKKSLKYLFVAACLALLVASIGGVVSASGTATETNGNLKIAGASLDLSDKISIAFAVEASAIGYDAEKNTAETNVYIYTENPTGKATAEGAEQVKTLKPMTVGGKDYVMFISEGFAPVAYGQTIYVRLVKGDGQEYGKVYKTSVIELVKNLQAKLDTNDARYTAKAGLYNAILTYGQTAQKVLGNKYPVYNYFTVEGGKYVDEAGQTWTSGVAVKGDKVNLQLDSDIGLTTVWTDGSTEYESNVVTVNSDNANYYPVYSTSIVDTNYWHYGWNGLASYAMKYDTLIKEYAAGKKLESTSGANRSTLNFSKDEAGDYVTTFNWPYKYYTAESNQTGIPTQEQTSYFMFSNIYAKANNTSALSFDLYFPGTDLNNNDTKYDFGPYKYTVDEPVLGENGEQVENEGEPVYETKTYYTNGDMFTNTGNSIMLRLPISLGKIDDSNSNTTDDFTNSARYLTTTLMWVHIVAVSTDNKVTGFKVGGANGADANKNNYTSSTVYDITVPHTIDFEFTTDSSGIITAVKVYVDGNLALTHLASNGKDAKYGLNSSTVKLTPAASNAHRSSVGFGVQSLGRFLGTTNISNVHATYNHKFAYSQIEANGYSLDAGNRTGDVATIVGYNSEGVLTHYAWNALSTLEGIGALGNYGLYYSYSNPANASWMYDANANSVIFEKVATSAQGAATILIKNPLYGQQATWDGRSAVFEFTMEMKSGDYNKDGLYDTDKDVISAGGSSVFGQILIGYGDGIDTTGRTKFDGGNAAQRTIAGISNNDSILGNYRIHMVNGKTGTDIRNAWALSYYHNSVNGADSCTKQVSDRYFGTAAVIRIIVTPNAETGIPERLDLYCDGVFIKTFYNGITDKTGFTFNYDDSTKTGAHANFFDAEYFELTQWVRNNGSGASEFSNIHTWVQTVK